MAWLMIAYTIIIVFFIVSYYESITEVNHMVNHPHFSGNGMVFSLIDPPNCGLLLGLSHIGYDML